MTVDRIIVLIPAQGADGVKLARKIRALALPCELKVVLLCAVDADADVAAGTDSNRESAARLRLATLASLIRDDRVEVTAHVLARLSWVGTVQRHYQPGDLVICCAEQKISTASAGRRPLYQLLEWVLNLPVYVLADTYTEPQFPRRARNAPSLWRRG